MMQNQGMFLCSSSFCGIYYKGDLAPFNCMLSMLEVDHGQQIFLWVCCGLLFYELIIKICVILCHLYLFQETVLRRHSGLQINM